MSKPLILLLTFLFDLLEPLAQGLLAAYVQNDILKNKFAKFMVVILLAVVICAAVVNSPLMAELSSWADSVSFESSPKNSIVDNCGHWSGDPAAIKIPDGHEACNLTVDLQSTNVQKYTLNVSNSDNLSQHLKLTLPKDVIVTIKKAGTNDIVPVIKSAKSNDEITITAILQGYYTITIEGKGVIILKIELPVNKK